MRLIWTSLSATAIATGSLSGCQTFPQSPIAVASASTLDERVALGAELSYTTASKLGTSLATARLIDAKRFKELDNEAYGALLAVREAYRAGNADNYQEAFAHLVVVIGEIQSLAKGSQYAH